MRVAAVARRRESSRPDREYRNIDCELWTDGNRSLYYAILVLVTLISTRICLCRLSVTNISITTDLANC